MSGRFSFGPATLVTAAFMGPGTVTACTLAGVNFGHALLWALLFSVVASMALQEMSARLGIVGRMGLGEALRSSFESTVGRITIAVLVISAIFIGNSAYEGGNISGAVLGLETIMPEGLDAGFVWTLLISGSAFVLLYFARYRMLENVLIGLVFTMSLTFLLTFILVPPSISDFFSGLFLPTIPNGSVLTVIALIGTTVVPYNLFLHASLSKTRYLGPEDLGAARKDIGVSMSIGGLISIAIMSTAAAAFFGKESEVLGAADMAVQLEPLLGSASNWFMGVGLLAAGVSSAITAPLAAAYAATGVLGWESDLKSGRFKVIWALVLISGTGVAMSGIHPIQIIWFAQVANGFLLPVMAMFLLKVMNNRELLGAYANSRRQNLVGMVVVLITILLSGRSLMSAFDLL